tara:strand:+ start:135 stop:515 length:381 start_codon:yes stop_codon:yes gene_type:complete
MNNSCQGEAEDPLDKDQDNPTESSQSDEGASLVIYVDAEGMIGFECEWGEGVDSLTAMGLIFYKLLEDNLADDVLKYLKKQCVIQERKEEYDTITQTVSQMKLLTKSSGDSDGDSIVISPSDASKM